MPREYEAIRDNLIKRGYSEEEAKELASRIYIGRGKTKKERSKRAKILARHRKREKKK